MARFIEHELYDHLFKDRHNVVIFGPGHSPEIDSSTLYLCTRNTHPEGRIFLVDSQIGDPLLLREEPGLASHFDKLMDLKKESGGEGNARLHVAEIEKFKLEHPEVAIRIPEIQVASGFDTQLPSDFADRALNRGALYWMLSKREDRFQGAKDAVAEMLRVLKTDGIGVILNEDDLLPDKDVTTKIRTALEKFKVPFDEHEIETRPFPVAGTKPMQPVYRYRKAFVFTKPKGWVLP